ncbi:MAG: 50S ribosomal protein L4 [Anaerolineales bacterium]|jgi:large subunit ribosomal protein L4
MEVDVLNTRGEKVSTVDLPVEIFQAPIRVDLMHQAYVRQIANARLGTHSTKRRNEVRGGGRKPWRQKGTGRARHGSIRSPIWVGGGKAHTPKPRKYVKQMPRKMRRSALRSALSAKFASDDVIVLDDISIKEPKTKLLVEVLTPLAGESSVLIVLPEKNEAYDIVMLSSRNLQNVKLLLANYLNIRDLLGYDKVMLPLSAIDVIKDYLM